MNVYVFFVRFSLYSFSERKKCFFPLACACDITYIFYVIAFIFSLSFSFCRHIHRHFRAHTHTRPLFHSLLAYEFGKSVRFAISHFLHYTIWAACFYHHPSALTFNAFRFILDVLPRFFVLNWNLMADAVMMLHRCWGGWFPPFPLAQNISSSLSLSFSHTLPFFISISPVHLGPTYVAMWMWKVSRWLNLFMIKNFIHAKTLRGTHWAAIFAWALSSKSTRSQL